ncbi:MAG: FG-GAP-like repeat-containing protein, partial [Planctomycetota bacterium]|nr:FG-GAP-like repeat-containing protein [Planctomycetota bacterium]
MWNRTATRLVFSTILAGVVSSSALSQERRPSSRNQGLVDGSQLLYSPAATAQDFGGTSVAIEGDIAVIGAPGGDGSVSDSGDVTVHRWNEKTNTWDFEARLGLLLDATQVNSGAHFGESVDIHGDRIIVGAPYAFNAAGDQSGRVYVFKWDGSAWVLHELIEHLYGDAGDRFGDRVAMNGTYAFIAARGEPNPHGGNGEVWSYPLTRQAAAPRPLSTPLARGDNLDGFGRSMDYADDVLVIGAPFATVEGTDHGLAYAYQCVDDSPTAETILYPPPPWDEKNSYFGIAVAAASDAVLIGATFLENSAYYGGGSFFRHDGDETWELESIIREDPTEPTNGFGGAVDLDGELAVIGASQGGNLGTNSGHAKLFRFAPSSLEWVFEAELNPEIGEPADFFGLSVGVGSRGVLIGARAVDIPGVAEEAGGCFAYVKQDGQWQSDTRPAFPLNLSQQRIEKPPWVDSDFPSFGMDISISGNDALVGDYRGGNPGDGGAVHLYSRDSETSPWYAVSKHGIVPPSLPTDSQFGRSVAILGDLAVVGAPAPYLPSGGTATVYVREKDVWSYATQLTGDYTSEQFGRSVAITEVDGETKIAVGAPYPTSDFFSGRVYIYTWDWLDEDAFLDTFLYPPDYAGGDSAFGCSIDMDVDDAGELVLVGGNVIRNNSSMPGSVDIFRLTSDSVWIHEQKIEPGDEFIDYETLAFGHDVAIDDGMLVVGAPESNYFGYNAGDAFLFRATPSSGVVTWTLESYLDTPIGRATDQFGWSVEISEADGMALVGAPWSDYMGDGSGLVVAYQERVAGAWWKMTQSYISTDIAEGDALGWAMAIDGSTLMTTAFTHPFEISQRPYLADFQLEDFVTWTTTTESALLSAPESWSIPPDGISTALFSMLLAEFRTVVFDLAEWTGSMMISLDQIEFLLDAQVQQGVNPSINGSLGISSPPELRTAVLSLAGGGMLQVEQDVMIGGPGEAGTLELAQTSLSVDGTLSLGKGSTITFQLPDNSGTSPTRIVTGQAPSLGGTLGVDLGLIPAEDLVVGQRFTLLSSAVVPPEGEDRYELVLLPGISKDLAFQLQHGAPPANRDGDASQGVWEIAIEVINLSDLLAFDDANTTAVEADATAVEVVDLNNDGAEEICVIFDGTPGQLVIFENDGAGGIGQQIVVNTGDEPVDITSGDFDGDGNQDLAVANHLSTDISVYLNDDADPSDGFTAADFSPGVIPTCLAGFDYLNIDDLDDLVIGYENAANPDGGFIIFAASNPLRA